MELFWKAMAGILISAVLSMCIKEKDMTLLLTLAASCLACVVILCYLEPVLDFLRQMAALASIEDSILVILIKSTGIMLVTELAGMICRDTGNHSLEKVLQMLGIAAVLFLSLPVVQSLIELIADILGECI